MTHTSKTMRRPSKVTPETAIKRSIKSYLNMKGYFFFHNLAGLGCYPGIPDITAMKGGRVYFIEVKSEKGKQSDRQKDFQGHVEDEGLLHKINCVDKTIHYIIATSTLDLEKQGI